MRLGTASVHLLGGVAESLVEVVQCLDHIPNLGIDQNKNQHDP